MKKRKKIHKQALFKLSTLNHSLERQQKAKSEKHVHYFTPSNVYDGSPLVIDAQTLSMWTEWADEEERGGGGGGGRRRHTMIIVVRGAIWNETYHGELFVLTEIYSSSRLINEAQKVDVTSHVVFHFLVLSCFLSQLINGGKLLLEGINIRSPWIFKR